MTQKEIEALYVGVSAEGFAYCKKNKAGKDMPVKKITYGDVMQVLSAMYAKHITENPEDAVMLLPMDKEGNALAVAFAKIEPKEEDKK